LIKKRRRWKGGARPSRLVAGDVHSVDWGGLKVGVSECDLKRKEVVVEWGDKGW
jgi:hypothetical protein